MCDCLVYMKSMRLLLREWYVYASFSHYLFNERCLFSNAKRHVPNSKGKSKRANE
jgi:hypothetical protein